MDQTCMCNSNPFPFALFNTDEFAAEMLPIEEEPPFLTAVGIASLIAVGVVGIVGFVLLFAARKTAIGGGGLVASQPAKVFVTKAPPQIVKEENLDDIPVAQHSRQVVSFAPSYNPYFQQDEDEFL